MLYSVSNLAVGDNWTNRNIPLPRECLVNIVISSNWIVYSTIYTIDGIIVLNKRKCQIHEIFYEISDFTSPVTAKWNIPLKT